ncbi:MAG: hypothetical protein WCA17_16500 [Burkholderiales bacterium]
MIAGDVMIHISESLNQEARTALENALRSVEGVIAPKFGAGKEHLLMIAFDPKKTSMAALLEKTRAAGYSARLVGM